MTIDKFGREFSRNRFEDDIQQTVEKILQQKLTEIVQQPQPISNVSKFIINLHSSLVTNTLQYLFFGFIPIYKFPIDSCTVIDVFSYGQALSKEFVISVNNTDYKNPSELINVVLNKNDEIKCRIPLQVGKVHQQSFLIQLVLEQDENKNY